MPLKRIADLPAPKSDVIPCYHIDHNPPKHIVLEDGVYEHVCSQCGYKTVFTVFRPTF